MLSIVPVLNQDSACLGTHLKANLGLAFDVGLNVIGIVSDNNKTNTKAVGDKLCNGKGHEIGPSFTFSHEGTQHTIAFLSDFVHAIKNVRNNWVNPVSGLSGPYPSVWIGIARNQ